MADFLTDEQMQKLEAEGKATPNPQADTPDFLSDEDMAKLETDGVASFQEPPAPDAPEVPKIESAVLGGAQGITAGFADEIAGVKGTIDQALAGKVDLGRLVETYRNQRDQSRKTIEDAKAANPATFGASELAGGIAGFAVPGMNVAKGVKGAAALGAVAGLGNTEADLTKGEIGQAAGDIALSSAIGAGAGKVGEKIASTVGPALEKGANVVHKWANRAQYGGLGAGAREIARDLGLGKTAFPGQEGLEQGMADTLRQHNILSLTGGSEAALKNIDNAINANTNKYNQFFDTIDSQVKQNADLSRLPAVPGTRIADATGGSLLDSFNALTEGFTGTLKKQYGGQSGVKAAQQANAEYGNLIREADYDLRKLNELKEILGRQLRETDWDKAPGELAPKKEFIRNLYGLVKGRMEKLADFVSPDAGQTMRMLNQESGNLTSARSIAFSEHAKSLKAPIVGLPEMLAGVSGVATANPKIIAAGVAKKGLELATGHSIDKLAKIATAKGLSGMATSMQSATDPAARTLSAKLFQLSQNESNIARIGGLSALMSDPSSKELISKYIPSTPKDVSVKTPVTTKGDQAAKVGYDKQYTEQNLVEMQSRITPEMGTSGEQLNNVLENIKGKEARSRNAMMFALEQNPAYRPLLRKLRNNNEGLAE
ncbi:MAG: hypothetical protein H7831_14660 [Magnetococcus sp. WYHC-3]